MTNMVFACRNQYFKHWSNCRKALLSYS